MRSLRVSATTMRPSGETATPAGVLNCLLAFPYDPKARANVPLGWKTWMRPPPNILEPVSSLSTEMVPSATTMRPSGETATPAGSSSSPSLTPPDPKAWASVPLG